MYQPLMKEIILALTKWTKNFVSLGFPWLLNTSIALIILSAVFSLLFFKLGSHHAHIYSNHMIYRKRLLFLRTASGNIELLKSVSEIDPRWLP